MLSIKFNDGELIQGKSWKDLPNKPIKRIKVHLGSKTLLLENYESYNFLIEKVYNILGGNQFVRSIYIIGRKNDKIEGIRANYLNKTIQRFTSTFGQEYNGKPSTGWKCGVTNQNPQYKVI